MGTTPMIYDLTEVVDYSTFRDFNAPDNSTAIVYDISDNPIVSLLIHNHGAQPLDYRVLGIIRDGLRRLESIPDTGNQLETSTGGDPANISHWEEMTSGSAGASGHVTWVNRGSDEFYPTHIRLQYKVNVSLNSGDVITQMGKTAHT